MRTRGKSRAGLSIAAVAGSLCLSLSLVPATAFADTIDTMPGLPTGLKVPGLENLTGGKNPAIGQDGRTNINLPIVPKGGVRKQFTNRPAVEQSTRPNCAPFLFVGVPGTFEINRDDDPNKPVGMLSKVTGPLSTALGSKFGTTMINYDADAGVNGTSYDVSVDAGTKKTLATVTDVASRCPKTSIILGGYSQGAHITGNVATDIGQKRTPVDPARIAGVVLISDPKRTANSNVIADTNQARPDVPAFLENALGALSNNPSFAQLQMSATDLLGNNGKDIAGSLTDMATQLAGAVTGSPNIAGGDPATQAPATTSVEPGASSTPEPSVPLDPSTPKIAGSSFSSTATFTQIDDTANLPVAADELKPIKAEDVDNGTMRQRMTDGISYIGKGTDWVPIAGAESISSAEFKAKAKEGGWVYGRTPAEKNTRRDVVDDLFLNGWDKCKDKTLAQCRGNFVDGMPDGTTADGFMVPSSELTATRDKIKAPGYKRPDAAILNGCLNKSSKTCAMDVQLKQAKQDTIAKSAKSIPNFDDVKGADRDKYLNDIKNVVGFMDGDGKQKPITELRDRNVGKIDPKGNFSTCHRDGNPGSAPSADMGEDNNQWLSSAWMNATGRWGTSNARFDRGGSVDQFHKRSGDINLHETGRECAAWSIAAFNDFEKLYTSGRIVFKEGYTPSNNPDNGKDGDRTALIDRLYQFGGCGDGFNNNEVTVPAPNGTWSQFACRSFFGTVDGKKNTGSKFTITQLGVLAGNAERQYRAQKPDWNAAVIPLNAVEGVHAYKSPFKCDTLSARACAILKSEITGPKTAPAGVTKVIKVSYPAIDDRGQIIFGDLAASAPVDPPAGQDPEKLYADGFRWATPEVIAAVAKFDDTRNAVAVGNDARKQPKEVNTLLSPTGEAYSVGEDKSLIAQQLGKGYVWDYTDEQKKKRAELFDDYFRYNQCGATSYDNCRKKLLEYGSKEYLLTEELITNATNKGKEADKQGSLSYKVEQLPTDLPTCKTKPVAECAGTKAAKPGPEKTTTAPAGTDSTSGSAPAPDATTPPADGGAPTTGSEAPTTGSDDGGNPPADAPADDSTTPADETPADTTAPTTSTAGSAGGDSTTTPTIAGSDPSGDPAPIGDDLANQFQNLITGGTATSEPESGTTTTGTNGTKVSVSPITQKAVAGGGLAGKRTTDFGQLKGRVVSLCVPGDIVCSLPEDSELAQDLVKFAQNVSLNFPDMVGDEGSTRMAGILTLQGLNTVANITGLPQTKLSAGTLQALINIVAGGAMIAAQQPAGAGLVADGVSKLPDAMPEIFAQLRDVPALLRGLSSAPQKAADNTGLSKVLARVDAAFRQAGMTSPLDIQKYPEATSALMQGLVKDNTGLVKMVTNPQYWKANAHVLYPELKISGQLGSLTWVSQWFDRLAVLAKLK